MGYWQFKSDVKKPAEQWARKGRAEWPDSVVIQFQPREILRYMREFACVLEAGTEDTYEMSIPGQLSPLYNDDEAGWIPLGDLPPGALFETKTGERGLVSTMGASGGKTLLFSLATGGPFVLSDASLLVRRLVLP